MNATITVATPTKAAIPPILMLDADPWNGVMVGDGADEAVAFELDELV